MDWHPLMHLLFNKNLKLLSNSKTLSLGQNEISLQTLWIFAFSKISQVKGRVKYSSEQSIELA